MNEMVSSHFLKFAYREKLNLAMTSKTSGDTLDPIKEHALASVRIPAKQNMYRYHMRGINAGKRSIPSIPPSRQT